MRLLSTREKRNHFWVEGISKPDGVAFADLPMVGIRDDLATTAVETVLRKLLRAFYYKHIGTILPKEADVAARWVPNAYFHTLDEPEFARLFETLPHKPPIRRGRHDISDQFSYRYGFDPTTGVSAYLMIFRRSIVALGAISLVPGVISDDLKVASWTHMRKPKPPKGKKNITIEGLSRPERIKLARAK